MNAALIESNLTGLDTFNIWQKARIEQQHAFNATPVKINQNDPQQLKQQLGYLAAEEEQRAARQALMQEVASQDDGFLPVAYRLGAVAAFSATAGPLKTKFRGKSITIINSDIFRPDMHEQQIRPSEDPVKLTVQVGDELERLRELLDTSTSVPVVMVWNNHFDPPRISYDEVVLGEIPNPRKSFTFDAPKVIEVNGEKVVSYKIPSRLHGVIKGDFVRKDQYVQPEDKYKNPAITTLVRLGVTDRNVMSHGPDALYIGKEDVEKRVARARIDNERYTRRLELLRKRHQRRR